MIFLLLPAKDEALNLPQLIRRAQELGCVVVVCDDGSSDDTAMVARAAGAIVLQHQTNRGLAATLRTLFDYFIAESMDGDLACVMDADGTMNPDDILIMAHKAENNGLDMVIASRFIGGGVVGLSWFRMVLSLMAKHTFTWLAPIEGVSDYTIGFRMYSRTFLKRYREIFPRYFEAEGFQAQTELLLCSRFLEPRPRIGEVPTIVRYDLKQGVSKMRVCKTLVGYAQLLYRSRASSPNSPF